MGTLLHPPLKGVGALPPKKKMVHVYCGQRAGWIMMVLRMEIGLSLGDFKWGPSRPPKFSADAYYSYCDFVRTLRRRTALLVF